MGKILIGRKKEKNELLDLFNSGKPEFVTVYGRRRVGKTFLVNSLFANEYAFKVTAILDNNTRRQLTNFAEALAEYSMEDVPPITDWFTAFKQLRILLQNSNRKRKVIFIDEMPWLDTKKSQFIPAFEHFWNGWASAQKDIMLIVCGSAASWIVKKLFRNRGGLHNRITRRIYLQPFTLSECYLYALNQGFPIDEISLLENYMIFGGVPYYLSLMNKNISFAQNIERLCFSMGGELRDEFNNLYSSLFKNASRHLLIVEALSQKKCGLTREDIKRITKLPEGGSLCEALEELELSGFVRKYSPFARKKKGVLYQLVDHFTLFYLSFVKNSSSNDSDSWMKMRETQKFRTWRGYAFERVCLSHIHQIQWTLGVAGIITHIESWRSEISDPGAQIDLIINRNDQVITLCEMKFSDSEFIITKKLAQELRNKRNVFVEETGTKKAVSIALITPVGVKRNDYYDTIQSIVTAEDILKD